MPLVSLEHGWRVPSAFDGSSASLAEHAEAIGALMAGEEKLWLGPFAPPRTLPAGYEDTALVVPTSGSTGAAKAVAHPLTTLLASQDATAARFAQGAAAATGGHGYWLPLLPPTHIAGIQVIARAHRAAQVLELERAPLPRTMPALEHFDAAAFLRAARPALEEAEDAGLPAFTSLVPTQLARILQGPTGDDAAARAQLRRFAAVLVGGAATSPEVLAAARAQRIAVATTYGSSETAGGCVYDRIPLEGVQLHLADEHDGEGRLLIDSPTLATGYLSPDGRAVDEGYTRHGGTRMLVTSDLARLEDGRLSILGRADDVIITGGRKVLPQDVERAVGSSPMLREVLRGSVVVGVEDPQWGQRIEALVVLSDDAPVEPQDLTALLRSALRMAGLPSHALPKQVHAVGELPLRGIGKVDRARAREIAATFPAPSR